MREIRFTPTEEAIYNCILQTIKSEQKVSVASIAKKVGVVPSSVMKLTKKLGYSGYNEMFYTLSEQNNDALSLRLDEFDYLTETNTENYINSLCEILYYYKSSNILIYSLGFCEYAAKYFRQCLWQRDFKAISPTDYLMYDISEHPTGIMFMFNESGVIPIQVCKEAKAADYNIISITGNNHSPLAMESHMSIEIKSKKSEVSLYEPNLFTAKVLIFIELLFSRYDEVFMSPKKQLRK